MKSEVPDHSVFVRYLLGELPEEEGRKLEEVCFEDDAAHEQLEAVEAELTDEYVRGELRGEQRAYFEQRVLQNPSRNQKIELSQLLTGVRPQPRRVNQSVIRMLALAAGVLLAVSGVWFLLIRSQPKPIETAQVRVPVQPQEVSSAPQVETAPPPSASRAAVPGGKVNKQYSERTPVPQSAPMAPEPAAAPPSTAARPAAPGLNPNRQFDNRVSLAGSTPMVPPPPPQHPPSAGISGRVLDSSGAVISGASVTLVDKFTGALKQASTDAEGKYTLSEIPAGKYDLKVDKAGFKEAVKTNLELASADRAQSDFNLSVGQSSSTVEVTAEAATVQPSSAQSSVTIDSRQISALPNFNDKAQKLPNDLQAALGTSGDGRRLYQQMIVKHGETKETRVSQFTANARNLLIEFTEPVLTGVTQSDAKEAITLGLADKQINGSLEEASAKLAVYLNQTCCGNSITAATIKVTGPSGLITGTLVASPDRRVVTFTPMQPFETGVSYRLVVENVRDSLGRPMKKKFNKTFSIKP